ncbi:hypothetical protein ACROYT_G040113 [Oculina patagonica]
MKTMLDRNAVLLFLSVLPVISSQQRDKQTTCPVFSGSSFFVNTSGENTETCGTQTKPCFSISYAVNLAVQQNISSVLINISTGSYKEMESIKLDCGRWDLQRITFWGARQDKQVVEVDLSLDVQFCEVSLVDLHWKNSRPVLHHALLSAITICQCTAQQTNVSIIASSSNIILRDSNISRCSGYQLRLPFLSVTSLPGYHNTLQIINCNIWDNVGPVLYVGGVQASIVASHLEGNKVFSQGKIITAQVSHLTISETRFARNFGALLGLNDGYSSASLEKCHFSCNMVNNSFFLSPVMPHSIHQVSCDNCTVDSECPVHCSPGEFLSSSILCNPCPKGSYSPGTVLNKTMLQCAWCPAGTYSSKTQSKMCTPCEEHTFSAKTGSTACTKCKNDFFTSKPGQSSCSTLTIGFIILTVCVILLIVVPLLILLIRNSSRTGLKRKCCSRTPLVEVTQKLCQDEKPNYSVQNA